jgi:hypothetical protein
MAAEARAAEQAPLNESVEQAPQPRGLFFPPSNSEESEHVKVFFRWAGGPCQLK